MPRIIGGINPIIPSATRYPSRAERMLFAPAVSLHGALLNFQVERGGWFVVSRSGALWSTIGPHRSTRTMMDDRARTLTKSRDYRYRVGVTQWRAWVTEKSLQGDPCSETGITPLATTCRISVITRFARRQVSW